MSTLSLEELAKNAVHFGHKTTRWNPKMKKYLYGVQGDTHVFDLRQTEDHLKKMVAAIEKVSKEGKTILFVSTKPQTKEMLEEFHRETSCPIVTNKWIGGLLTNFDTMRGRIKEMKAIDEMFTTGEIEKYTKKERSMLAKKLEKLKLAFGGIADMYRKPDAIFIVDGKRDHTAILEAKCLNIPVFGFADSNVDPDDYNMMVPANDDAISSLAYLFSFVFAAAKKAPVKKEEVKKIK